MQVDDKYVPDPRTIIYEMLKERRNLRSNPDYYVEEKQFDFYKENGGKIEVTIKQENRFGEHGRIKRTIVVMKAGDSIVEKEAFRYGEYELKLIDALTYAKLLDQIFNMDWEQKLLQEIQDLYINRTLKKSPIYDSLRDSLDNILQEFDNTNLDFQATEEAKRKHFYEKNKFKKQLKQKDDITAEETQKTTPQHKKVTVKVRKRGLEQGGE